MTVPIYLKNDANMPRPHDRQYYLVTGNGMFVCRNEEFWESDVPSSRTPRGLAGHRACCKVRFPKLGTAALEYVVAFFEQVYRVWGAESIVLLLWDTLRRRYRLCVPRQEATVWQSTSGLRTALDVVYKVPTPLPAGHLLIGDIHCHCDFEAGSSSKDRQDEAHRDGIHVIAGHVEREPPDFHLELSVDGARFGLEFAHVFRGYRRRRRIVPQVWLEQVRVNVQRPAPFQGTIYVQSACPSSLEPKGLRRKQ